MMDPKPDSLYNYKDGCLTPSFTVDFGSKTPMHQYTSTPRFFEFATFGDAEQVSESSFIVRQNVSFIVDRKSLRGGYAYLDLDGVAPIELESMAVWQDPGLFLLLHRAGHSCGYASGSGGFQG